ncbi:MAG: hypothetical protein LBH30_03230 [Prevotellaceae bacterium]|jgi:hypothetical protein|nr:hypothetical protein [Prevotellaceae bacterium]
MSYNFLGFDNGWFGNNFEEYMLLWYIGDKERFQKEIERKSLFQKLFKSFLPELKISAIINKVIGFDLVNNQGTNVLEKIFDILEDEKNRKTITEHLKSIYKKGRKSGKYFEHIEKDWGKTTLSDVDKNDLEGKLITVEGNLIHRSSVVQYSKNTNSQFSKANFEWLLSDFPPHGLTSKNERFKGDVLILSEDKGFTAAFSNYLPFCLPISWYPFVRITGFYSSSKQSVNGYPSLSIVLTEYRPPKNLNAVLPNITNFLTRELKNKNYLKESEDFELFAYLIPILFQKANLTPELAESDLSNLLKKYRDVLGANIPNKLISFYDNLP